MQSYINAAKVLPKELVQEIRKHYTGMMYVPNGNDREARRKLVIALHSHSTPAKEIAILAGLSLRRVHQIIAEEFPKKRPEPFSTLSLWQKGMDAGKES